MTIKSCTLDYHRANVRIFLSLTQEISKKDAADLIKFLKMSSFPAAPVQFRTDSHLLFEIFSEG